MVVDISDGTVVQKIDYDPWGVVIADTNEGFQPFAFAGGQLDSSTALTRFGARDYDPATGRWIAKDPLGMRVRETNLYKYSACDPVNKLDTSGLDACMDCYSDCTDKHTACTFVCEKPIASQPPANGCGLPGHPDNFEKNKKKCLEDCEADFKSCAKNCMKRNPFTIDVVARRGHS